MHANAPWPLLIYLSFAYKNVVTPQWFQYLSLPIQWISYKATWQGAETPFYCCVDPAAVPGEYHAECRVVPALPISYNMDLAAELWRRSEQMVGLQGEEGMPMMSDKDKVSSACRSNLLFHLFLVFVLHCALRFA